MSEPTNTELRIAIAELAGKVDGYQAATHLEMGALSRRLDDHLRAAERSLGDYQQAHRTVEDRISILETRWAYMLGIGGGMGVVATVLSLYAVLHGAGVHF